MESSLPPEIWFTIVDHLPRSDQLRISQVSLQLCAVARRLVYRNVELRSNDSAAQATLALLARDYSVARNVKQLYIHTSAKAEKGPTWFNADALAGMTNLRGLDLTRMPFHTKEDQVKFNNIISKLLPALRKLEYGFPYSKKRKTQRQSPGTHMPALQISGLQEITWIDPDVFVHPSPILPLINASRDTLTDIRIPILIGHAASYDSLIQFLTLRFPHLSTLHLGGWYKSAPVGAALSSFLIAHPLIEVLHLGLSNFSESGTICHVSPDIALDHGTLPRLCSLKADAFNLGIFSRSCLSSLRTLGSLHTGVGHHGDGEGDVEFAEMYNALETCGGLLQLRTLKLELKGLEGDLEHVHWIAGLGRLCPKVERFWGDLGVGWVAVTSQDLFASYGNLKLLVMPDNGLGRLRKRDRMDGVREFAAHNPSATDLQFYSPGDVDAIKFRFVVERDTAGGIASMVEVLKGRPLRVAGFADFASKIRYAGR